MLVRAIYTAKRDSNGTTSGATGTDASKTPNFSDPSPKHLTSWPALYENVNPFVYTFIAVACAVSAALCWRKLKLELRPELSKASRPSAGSSKRLRLSWRLIASKFHYFLIIVLLMDGTGGASALAYQSWRYRNWTKTTSFLDDCKALQVNLTQ